MQLVARELGFDECRIAPAVRAPHADLYLEWVAEGKAGDMKWLERNLERRTDPRVVLPGARAVVCLALNYYPGSAHPHPDYRIARYSWNDDYHDVIEEKLADLDLAMQEMGGRQRFYVDTGPVLERDFASEAGVGWNGKSTVQIHRRLGTWFFLAELITTLPLPRDPPHNDHCGKCTACMTACPTGAIPRPHHVDAPRCISYLTIEHKGAIPVELRPLDRRTDSTAATIASRPARGTASRRPAATSAFTPAKRSSATSCVNFSPSPTRNSAASSPRPPSSASSGPAFSETSAWSSGMWAPGTICPPCGRAAADCDPLIAEHADWAIDADRKARRIARTVTVGRS